LITDLAVRLQLYFLERAAFDGRRGKSGKSGGSIARRSAALIGS
jgi:hypothetical protein